MIQQLISLFWDLNPDTFYLLVFQTLINAEPNTVDAVNNAKESPLHLSAQHGHGKVVTVLLAVCFNFVLI